MKRDLALDSLKVLLAVFVVGIHSYFLNGSGTLWGDLLGNGLFRVAVPVFFIINGYFFSRVLAGESLMPWFKKVFFLYMAWMVVFLPFYIPGSLTVSSFARFLKTLALGYHHIWYLSAFILSGIVIYLLRNRSSRFLVISAGILFSVGVFLQYVRAYISFPQSAINNLLDVEWISRNFLFMAYPFMVTGILIRRHSIQKRLSPGLVWSLLGIGLTLVFLEAGMNYAFLKETRHSFDCLLALGLAAPALFLAITTLPWTHSSKRLSDLSMVIYFVHPLFISLLVDGWGIANNGINITGWTLFLSVLIVPVHDGVRQLLSRTFQPLIATG
ncbi:acyltransferase [Puniceicoccales bacterium CK1056]|uniref:Acyltransferase n=1 Tax=Oceanipulchritudo coccoides TaxID=2706888 RepID=A0A6B2M1T9_9BACT|nr:acyltransferase family protein [Oceanipulchritudo coccoides]NDV62312.1 acyltransferase [Oceanipulchritudo coccoides]